MAEPGDDQQPRATGFEPADPDFAARVAASFVRQQFMQMLSAELQLVEAGRVEIGLSARPELTQQHGFVHAGVVTSLLDTACGYAALSLMPSGSAVLTVELKVNLLAPATGIRLLAHGEVLRAGRTLTVCRGDAFVIGEARRRHVATILATMAQRRDSDLDD